VCKGRFWLYNTRRCDQKVPGDRVNNFCVRWRRRNADNVIRRSNFWRVLRRWCENIYYYFSAFSRKRVWMVWGEFRCGRDRRTTRVRVKFRSQLRTNAKETFELLQQAWPRGIHIHDELSRGNQKMWLTWHFHVRLISPALLLVDLGEFSIRDSCHKSLVNIARQEP